MSTHPICFHGEIRKISTFWFKKKCLIWRELCSFITNLLLQQTIGIRYDNTKKVNGLCHTRKTTNTNNKAPV